MARRSELFPFSCHQSSCLHSCCTTNEVLKITYMKLRYGLIIAAVLLSVGRGVLAQTATATNKPSDLVLSNDNIRLRFHRAVPGKFGVFPQGFSGYTIDLKTSAGWVAMARAPYFTAFSYRSGWGRDWLHYVIPATGEIIEGKGETRAVFTGLRWDLDAMKWDFTFEFSLKPGANWIDATYTAKPERQGKLMLLWGPRLYAGDGSFGDAKDEALFAGLEYLGPGERSSANSALAPDAQMWFAPTPVKMTIPLMCIVKDGSMVGLMWNPMQKWLGEETCPSAVFAAPNWIESKTNHLLGLFVPNIPKFAAENSFRAHTPAIIETGQTVSISCRIFAAPGKHVTDAVDLYLKATGGLPQPAREPMNSNAALEMFVKALTDQLSDGKTNGWPGNYWADGNKSPWLQTSLLLGEAGSLLKNQELAKQATELGKTIIATRSERPLALALRIGGLAGVLQTMKSSSDKRLESQGLDGSWDYAANKDAEYGLSGLGAPPELGQIAPEGFKSQGYTAGELVPLLEYVKMTGDEEVFRAGLKGLEHIDSYAIPTVLRQVECPPAPSLHGAYLASRCHLIAYQITGDHKHLEKATYWAKTGLPFIYLWSLGPHKVASGHIPGTKQAYFSGSELYEDPQRDPMLYGGLYGFGSSQFSHHWNGIAVQWIPLVYARELADLAEFDQSLPWQRVARGIMTSALWQTYDQPPHAGFLPDAFSFDSWTPSGHAFPPGMMLEALLRIQYGRGWQPQTVIARDGKVRCHVTSAKRATDAKLDSGKLSFALHDPTWPQVRAIIAGVNKPAEILADGKPLPKVEDLESKDECWSVGPPSLVLVKVKSGDKPRRIEVRFSQP